jgi:hypothetical protein
MVYCLFTLCLVSCPRFVTHFWSNGVTNFLFVFLAFHNLHVSLNVPYDYLYQFVYTSFLNFTYLSP